MEFDLRKFLTENRITPASTPPESLDMSDVLLLFKKYINQFYSDLHYWYESDEEYSRDKTPFPDFSEWEKISLDVEILEEIRTDSRYIEFFAGRGRSDVSEDLLDRYLEDIRGWIQDPQFQYQATLVMDDLRDSLKDESGYDDPDQYDNWASSRGVRGGRMFEQASGYGKEFVFKVTGFDKTTDQDTEDTYITYAGGYLDLVCDDLPGLTLRVGADVEMYPGDNYEITQTYPDQVEVQYPGNLSESDYSDYLDTHYSSDGMDDYYSDKASQHTAEVLYTVGYELHKIGRTKEAESYRQQALDAFPEWTETDLPPY